MVFRLLLVLLRFCFFLVFISPIIFLVYVTVRWIKLTVSAFRCTVNISLSYCNIPLPIDLIIGWVLG